MVFFSCFWTLICFWAIGFVWVYHARRQRALQWWWKRQVMQAYENAESLRNHALQESFALRRHLELVGVPDPSDMTLTLWQSHVPLLLESANRLHREVQSLSDQLSSPFLEDSLPLALRHEVTVWKQHCPMVAFSLDLPTHWKAENEIKQDILTKILDECLHLLLLDLCRTGTEMNGENYAEKVNVVIALDSKKNWNCLKIQMLVPSALADSIHQRYQYFRYLGHVFQTLMPGRYTLKLTPQTLFFEGRWKSL
ncbi:hypothetical protein [Vacuolonema iberomarrocanum]|uniref:hypothetical protein n=1 Tax=Vacuolonema iberomarrocanum TaxID=3454632 RepID=UPI003F6DBF06